MRDFIESMWKQVRDRMSSPVFGSFAIAWLCWNHRYFVILLSGLPVEYRFSLAKSLLYPTSEEMWLRLAIYPGLSCLGYILIYPLVSQYLLVYWDWQQTRIDNLRKKAQGKRLLSKDESDALVLEMIDLRASANETISKQAREIEVLRKPKDDSGLANELTKSAERIKTLEEELERVRKESVPQSPLGHLDESMKEGVRTALRLLASANNQRLASELILKGLGQVSEARKRAVINATIGSQLVQRTGNGDYYLTEQGLAYVVREGLDK